MRTDSPGGGPPGNGEGVIFPCWKAAAVEEEKKIDITNNKNVLYAIYVYKCKCAGTILCSSAKWVFSEPFMRLVAYNLRGGPQVS